MVLQSTQTVRIFVFCWFQTPDAAMCAMECNMHYSQCLRRNDRKQKESRVTSVEDETLHICGIKLDHLDQMFYSLCSPFVGSNIYSIMLLCDVLDIHTASLGVKSSLVDKSLYCTLTSCLFLLSVTFFPLSEITILSQQLHNTTTSETAASCCIFLSRSANTKTCVTLVVNAN